MTAVPLRLRGVGKVFGRTMALHDVTLDVDRGELVAIVGPSGSGKTTLGRIVAGFERPTRGTVEIDGRTVAGDNTWTPPEARRVGIVPQDGALFPHLDVAGNVGAGLRRSAERDQRIVECLALVGLADRGRDRPDQLSGGQQQRVALARALAPAPSLIVLDEPFSALDAGRRGQVRRDVAATLRSTGSTALLITHDQDEALSMADRVAVLIDGEIRQVDDPQAIYTRPTSLAVARFLGRLVELPAQPRAGRLSTALGELDVTGPFPADESIVAAIRPEQLRLTDAPDAPGAVVREVEYLGHDAVIGMALDDGTAVAARWASVVTASTRRRPQVGDRVGVAVDGPVLAFTDDRAAPGSR